MARIPVGAVAAPLLLLVAAFQVGGTGQAETGRDHDIPPPALVGWISPRNGEDGIACPFHPNDPLEVALGRLHPEMPLLSEEDLRDATLHYADDAGLSSSPARRQYADLYDYYAYHEKGCEDWRVLDGPRVEAPDMTAFTRDLEARVDDALDIGYAVHENPQKPIDKSPRPLDEAWIEAMLRS